MRRPCLLIIVIALCLVACTAGPNSLSATPDAEGVVAGFWSGLWHGLILPFSFAGSIFTSHVSIYEVHNSGGWYNFGFLVGAGMTLGGSARTTVVYRNQKSTSRQEGNTYDA